MEAASAIPQNLTLNAVQERLARKRSRMGDIARDELQIRRALLSLRERYLEISEERRALWEEAKLVVKEIRELRDLERLGLRKEGTSAAVKEMFEQ